MISLDFSALAKISSEHGLTHEEIFSEENKLSGFLENIHGHDQGFFSDNVLQDTDLIAEIEDFSGKVRGKYRFIVILGIGGSALGAITLKEAFGPLFGVPNPRLFILDNIDPDLLAECEKEIELEKTLFLVVTKSGGTPETLSQYFYFRKRIQEAGYLLPDHFIFITDPEKGYLRAEGNKNGVTSFAIPSNVGGRFSVLTAVGLLPAALIGIDIRHLLQGARMMRENFLSSDMSQNLPFQLAVVQYLLSRKGKTIHVLMPYSQKLFRFADWYRQLLAESIGKARNRSGKIVHAGITPVNALGVTDQHSQSQLYMEGPFDKLLIFLKVQNFGTDMTIPVSEKDAHFGFMNGISFGKLIHTELAGTARALTENDRPHITIDLPEISETSLGALFMLCEGAVAFLGEFFGINAFDQPGVELSKTLTKELLQKKNSGSG